MMSRVKTRKINFLNKWNANVGKFGALILIMSYLIFVTVWYIQFKCILLHSLFGNFCYFQIEGNFSN